MKLEEYEATEMFADLLPGQFVLTAIHGVKGLTFQDSASWDRYDTIKMDGIFICVDEISSSGPLQFLIYVVNSVFYIEDNVYDHLFYDFNKESVHFAQIKRYKTFQNIARPAKLLN